MKGYIKILILSAVFLAGVVIGREQSIKLIDSEINGIRSEINQLSNVVELAEEYQTIILDLQEDNRKLVETLDRFDIDLFEVTGYSPFDDRNGLNSDGNPTSTATGTYPTEGRTIAVEPRVIPYGSKVWIDGHGWRVAEDTGGMIKGNSIDVMVDSFDVAMDIGRKQKVVVYEIRE